MESSLNLITREKLRKPIYIYIYIYISIPSLMDNENYINCLNKKKSYMVLVLAI